MMSEQVFFEGEKCPVQQKTESVNIVRAAMSAYLLRQQVNDRLQIEALRRRDKEMDRRAGESAFMDGYEQGFFNL